MPLEKGKKKLYSGEEERWNSTSGQRSSPRPSTPTQMSTLHYTSGISFPYSMQNKSSASIGVTPLSVHSMPWSEYKADSSQAQCSSTSLNYHRSRILPSHRHQLQTYQDLNSFRFITSTHLNDINSSATKSPMPPSQTTNYWAPHNQIVGNYNDTIMNNFRVDSLQLLNHEIQDVGATHSSEARYPPPKCHLDTRKEILQQLMSQIDSHSGPAFYWLSGSAGTGKSAVAQTISEICAKDGKLAASFFFSWNYPKRNIPTYLFPTIAYGLASSVPKLQHFIGSAIQSDPSILHSSLEIQFSELIAKPCRLLGQQEVEWRNHPPLVVIDGLDECNGGDLQTRVLGIIADAFTDTEGLPLQFLVCSHPEPVIKEFFGSGKLNSYLSCHFLHNDDSTQEDIRKFLQDGFHAIHSKSRNQHLTFPDPWPLPDKIWKIALKSCGQFIYPSTILRYVDDEFSNPCKRLDEALGLTPPLSGTSPFRELDVLYHHILSVNPNKKLVLDILGTIISWKLFNQHSLKLQQVGLVLNLQVGDIALALRGMHSVVVVYAGEKIKILRSHFLLHTMDLSSI